MTISQPHAELVIDGRTFSAAQAALARLQVDLGVAGAHDRFRVALASQSPAAGVKAGANVEIRLGVTGTLETVLKGKVSSVARMAWGVVVEGFAATEACSATLVGKSFVRQEVGAIVKDLLAAANVDAGEIAAPLKLAAYHVDERRSVWAHLQDLARLSACEISTTAHGALNFRPFKQPGGTSKSLRYGADLLAWDVGPTADVGPDVTVVPFGAASEEGAEKWHLVLRQPEGSSPKGPVLIPASVRDRDGASTLQDGLRKGAARRAVLGHLVVMGAPSLRAGDIVELKGVPSGDATLRVTGACHDLGPNGFHTHLGVEGAA